MKQFSIKQIMAMGLDEQQELIEKLKSKMNPEDLKRASKIIEPALNNIRKHRSL